MQKIKLSIPDPCQQNWDHMTASQQGRFCNACAKTVIDFSQMSDADVLNYFSRSGDEKVCGRMYPDQLDRTIQAPPTRHFLWRWNYIIAFFLFFTKAGAAKAQGGIVKQTAANPYAGLDSLRGLTEHPASREILVGKVAYGQTKQTPPAPVQALSPANRKVTGRITGENGEGIPGASILIMPGTSGVVADSQGNFTANVIPGKESLRISAIGYETKTISVFEEKDQTIVLKSSNGLLGEVVVTGHQTVKGRMVRMGGISSTRGYAISTSIKNLLSPTGCSVMIYPNPVQKGSFANIEMNLKKGMYNLHVLDAAGNILLQKQVNSPAGRITEQFDIPPTWPAGKYFIKVDAGNKKTEVGNFIIL
jgi:hypothetical protein